MNPSLDGWLFEFNKDRDPWPHYASDDGGKVLWIHTFNMDLGIENSREKFEAICKLLADDVAGSPYPEQLPPLMRTAVDDAKRIVTIYTRIKR